MLEKYAIVMVTQPAVEPLTLAEAKLHLRVADTFTADDDYVTALIVAARRFVENYTGRALIEQTFDLKLDSFPCWQIDVPRPPLISVTSITYVDTAGDTQTVDAADYQVDTDADQGGRIQPAYLKYWKSTRADLNAVVIRCIAGYLGAGSPASDYDYSANVPAEIKQAMLLVIGHLYEHRESVSEQAGVINAAVLPQGATWLLAPYRVGFL